MTESGEGETLVLKHATSSCSSGRAVQGQEVSQANLTQPLPPSGSHTGADGKTEFSKTPLTHWGLLLMAPQKSPGRIGPKPNSS